jgi:PAS domain S-box-containing protein
MTQTQDKKSVKKEKKSCHYTEDSALQPYYQVDNDCINRQTPLRSETQLNEMIFQNAPIIIMILNKQGCIERFNPFMERLSGYRLSEVKGKDWFQTFLPLSLQENTREMFFKAINNIHTQGNINPIITKAGEELEISWYDNTIKDIEGNVTGLLCIGHDISNFYDAKKEAESIRQIRTDYLDTMGHEIRTPMNAILGFSEILSDMITDKKQKEYLNTIKTSVQTLLSVLDQPGKADETLRASEKNLIDPDHIVFQKNTTILVVDDVSSNRYVLSHYLKAFDFQILQADNGETAIMMAKEFQPDLIFMDYHMPVIDGYKAARMIYNENGLKKIPIVIVTASVTQKILDKMESEGFSYIKKPFHKNTIVAKLIQHIPYTVKDENRNDVVKPLESSEESSFDIKQTLNILENFPDFKTILKTQFYPRWKIFHEKLYIDYIQQWALNLNEQAVFFSCKPLQDYSNRILENIDSFDLVSLQKDLKEFPIIIGIS